MKRLLIFALVLALALPLGGCADKQDSTTPQPNAAESIADYGPHRPVGVYAVEEQLRDKDFWAQTTPVTERNRLFYEAQRAYFNYFYTLWGFDVSLDVGDTDRFSDTEVLHSVCARLNQASVSGSATVFTKAELNAAAKRYYGQTIEKFTDCSDCSYNSETAMYTWNTSCITTPGNFMVLRQLRVEEDGTCVGIFDRSHEQYYTGDTSTSSYEDIHNTILNGVYDDLSRVDTVVMTFREAKTDEGDYYLQILSITTYTGVASNTK